MPTLAADARGVPNFLGAFWASLHEGGEASRAPRGRATSSASSLFPDRVVRSTDHVFEAAERDAKEADAGLWDKCDRDKIRARRAAVKRRKAKAEARRVAAAERRAARRVRRAAAGSRQRAAARRAARMAAEDDGGGSSSGGSCGPGDIDGDGDGVCNEGSDGGGSSGGGSSGGGSSGFACGPGDIDGDNDGRCNE